jgi:sterol desaturase/sphingolipid hydroxylase (fatty acid hydroxylase superfamily)
MPQVRDIHSGHDVWWSLDNWMPYHLGGGGAPHDIHHVRPTKNFSFVFGIWDVIFGTFEAPVREEHKKK